MPYTRLLDRRLLELSPWHTLALECVDPDTQFVLRVGNYLQHADKGLAALTTRACTLRGLNSCCGNWELDGSSLVCTDCGLVCLPNQSLNRSVSIRFARASQEV